MKEKNIYLRSKHFFSLPSYEASQPNIKIRIETNFAREKRISAHSVADLGFRRQEEPLESILIFLPISLCYISGIPFSLNHFWSDSGAVDIGVDNTQDTRDTTYTSRNDKHCRRG